MAWPVIAGSNDTPPVPISALKWSTCLTSGPTLPPLGAAQRTPLFDAAATLMGLHDPARHPQILPRAQIPMQREPQAKPMGTLRNGNPRGNPNAAPRCGAKTRIGCPCRSPAMKNGRCRMHGGASTGPSADGRARIAAARTIHGGRSAAIRALDRGIAAVKRRGSVVMAMARAGLKVEDLAEPILRLRTVPAGRPSLPRTASTDERNRCFVLRELTAMDFTAQEVRSLLAAIAGRAQIPLHREGAPKPRRSAQDPIHREASPIPPDEPRVCHRPRHPLPCRHHCAESPFPARANPHAPWGDAKSPPRLTLLRGDIPDPSRERPDVGLAERQMHPLVGRGAMRERHARLPFPLRPDGPGREPAAAVRANVPQLGVHALGAEGAFVGADAGERGVRRQIAVAPLAVRTDLQGHRGQRS